MAKGGDLRMKRKRIGDESNFLREKDVPRYLPLSHAEATLENMIGPEEFNETLSKMLRKKNICNIGEC